MTFDLLNLILVLIVTIGAIVIGYLLCQIVGIRKAKHELKSKCAWNQESKQMCEYRDLSEQFSMVCEEKDVYASSPTVSLSTEYMGVSSFARLEFVRIANSPSDRIEFLMKEKTTFGRSEEMDIMISDMTVSRFHLVFRHSNDELEMCPMSTGNGVYCNGVQLEPMAWVLVPQGAVIIAGKTEFKVVIL